jgi:uncharacterized repeat protein (TIGR01451 family)
MRKILLLLVLILFLPISCAFGQQTADLSVTKTASNSVPTVGSNVNFTITVMNSGPSIATSVLVLDLLPSGFSFVSSTSSIGTYSALTGMWTIGTLSVGTTHTLNVLATVLPAGNYQNCASVSSSSVTDPIAANNTSCITIIAVPLVDLWITKTINNPTAAPGTNVTFTIVAGNNGPSIASGVNVNDLLPMGYIFVSSTVSAGIYDPITGIWLVSNLNSGSSETLTVTATVLTTGNYQNCALVYGNQPDSIINNNQQCASATGNNAAPVANDDFFFMQEDTQLSVSIIINDVDINGNLNISTTDLNLALPGTQSLVNNFFGIWDVNNFGLLTFTPSINFCGSAQLTYTISDSSGAVSNIATITVNVFCENDPPVISNEYLVTLMDTPISEDVLMNDFDPDGTALSATIFAGPINGTVVFNQNTLLYTPFSGFVGLDTIIVLVCDSGMPAPSICGTDTVFITILPTPNVAPIASNDTLITNEDIPGQLNISVNDTDSDGNIVLSTIDLDLLSPLIQDSVLSVNGLWYVNLSGILTFTPSANFCGTEQLNYTIQDDDGATSNVAQIIVTVNCINDIPVVDNEYLVTAFNAPISGDLIDLGDFDSDGILSANVNPSSGPMVGASITINPNGTFTYTPALNFSGNDTVIVQICDDGTPLPANCIGDTIFITVLPQVVPPTANLSVVKIISDMNPNVGSTVIFTISASNLGPDTATNVVVNDLLPSGYTFQTFNVTSGSYSGVNGNWSLGTLPNGGTATLTIIAIVNASGNYQNCASISGSQSDPANGNNTDCVTPNVISTVGCISGILFCDANNNGVQNAGEQGVGNASVILTYNGQSQTAVTNAAGLYTFSFPLSVSPQSATVTLPVAWLAQNGYQYASNTQTFPISGCGLNNNVHFPLSCVNVQNYLNCISGWVFCDANGNDLLDSGEVTLPNVPVQINIPGLSSYQVFSNSAGYYNFTAGNTNFQSGVVGIPYYYLAQFGLSMSPSSVFVNTNCSSATPTNLAITCPSSPCADLYATTFGPWQYFQNQAYNFTLNWGNYGFSPAQSYQLILKYPSGVIPATLPTTLPNFVLGGDSITWTFSASNLNSFNMSQNIQFLVGFGIPNGTVHTYTIKIVPTGSNPDCHLYNNSYSFIRIVGNSYDPNDKAVNQPMNINPDIEEEFVYTVRFQNTGTAPAQNIYVLDTLSPNLDWSTFKVEYFSHFMNVISLPNGVKRFDFPGIWLPDSTSNEPLSHGQFIYSIKEKADNPIGSSIENTAYIYFDWNPAIITNTTVNINTSTLGMENLGTNEIKVYPNPFDSRVQLTSSKRMERLTVYDLTGKVILTGSYFVKIESNGEFSNVRIVKK